MTVTATQLHDRTAELTERVLRDPENPLVVEKHGKPAIVPLGLRRDTYDEALRLRRRGEI